MCDPRHSLISLIYTSGDRVIVLIPSPDHAAYSPVTEILRIERPEGNTVVRYFGTPVPGPPPPEQDGDG